MSMPSHLIGATCVLIQGSEPAIAEGEAEAAILEPPLAAPASGDVRKVLNYTLLDVPYMLLILHDKV